MSDLSAPTVGRVSRLRSAAAEIPAELFEPILWHATQTDPQALQHDTIAHIRSVAPLTLVSTYFAKHCRPRMYEFVVLANQKRLEGLLAILHSGCKPLKEYLTDFTRSITVRYSEIADTIWALRAVRVLIPTMRYVGAKHLPDLIIDTDGALLPGLVPGQTQLPCSLPPSIFQHVQQLDLRSLRFERGEDFLQCISILRNISSISLHGCHSATPLPPMALTHIPSNCLANLRRVSGLISDLDTETCCATVLLQVFFYNSGRNSRSDFHSGVQALAVVDLIRAIYGSGASDRRSSYAWNLTIENDVLQIDPAGNCRDAIGSIRLVATPQLSPREGEVRYDCIVRPFADSRLKQLSTRTQVVCSDLLERVVHLKYLKNLEFHFSRCEEMARFIEVAYHALRTTHATGQRMRFRYEPQYPGSGCVARHPSTPKPKISTDNQDIEMKAKSLLYDISILWWEAGPHEIDFADMDVFIQRLEALGKNIAFKEDSDDIIANLRKQFAETHFSTQLLIGASLDQLLSPEHRHWGSFHWGSTHPRNQDLGFVVPQEVYISKSDIRDLGYASPTSKFYPDSPIVFFDSSTGLPGIPLNKALSFDYSSGPSDWDTRPKTTSGGNKIGIRILWPGYDIWTDHMNATEHATGETQHLTKGRLAHEVAKRIRDFHRDMSSFQSTDPNPSWWLNRIPLNQLVLIELRNVSSGSWQPVIIWRV